ncbi:MAG: AAA family ATPase [Bacteroidia bacterium]|nr:AAA family ATPase [Bacteroidia bacterium]
MIAGKIKFYSWVDIQDRLIQYLEGRTLPAGMRMELFSSGLFITYHPAMLPEDDIRKLLRNVLPNRLNDQGNIILDSLPDVPATFPVYIEETEEEITAPDFLPSFARPSIFSQTTPSSVVTASRDLNTNPVMIATHSFKGGVGRTLHAMALAIGLVESTGKKVLLIDADFEAPGITFTVHNPDISFVDFLNLIHGSENLNAAIELAAKELLNQQKDQLIFMPAFRLDEQMRTLEIKPEHIFRFSPNPFIITDQAAELARKVQADYVIIDLRAGISELSSSWLLDPRVANVFVTTLASQSVEGTCLLIDLLKNQQVKHRLIPAILPSLIISQVENDRLREIQQIWSSPEDRGSNTSSANTARLRDAFQDYIETLEFHDQEVPLAISPMYSELRVLPNDWNDIVRSIKTSGMIERLADVRELFQSSAFQPAPANMEADIREARRKLNEIVPNLLFAEKNESQKFYKSEAIRKLVEQNQSSLPKRVIIGAKGAGKTFLYRQLVNAKNWRDFSEAVARNGHQPPSAAIVPVTFPENLPDAEKTTVWVQIVKDRLNLFVSNGQTDAIPWRSLWLDTIAWSCGFQPGQPDVFTAFLQDLIQRGEKIIAIFDGLEDLFSGYDQSEPQKRAIKALIQDTLEYIAILPNAPLGCIIFVRGDIIDHVIVQNSEQFRGKHREYELKWNREEALRLILWILSEYDIIDMPGLNADYLHALSENELKSHLYILWGVKLGSKDSREAFSEKFVLNALSNFKGEIQSRDLIRFLEQSIKLTINTPAPGEVMDRILRATAIRSAIPEVSKKKIQELREENRNNRFAEILNKIQVKASEIRVPFETSEVLTQEEIALLDAQGVLKRAEDRYYMAEIYRAGLGISATRGKRRTAF